MKKAVLFMSVLLVLGMIVSCDVDDVMEQVIVGEWENVSPCGLGQIKSHLTINSDGTYEQLSSLRGEGETAWEPWVKKLGDYDIVGTTLTMNCTEAYYWNDSNVWQSEDFFLGDTVVTYDFSGSDLVFTDSDGDETVYSSK